MVPILPGCFPGGGDSIPNTDLPELRKKNTLGLGRQGNFLKKSGRPGLSEAGDTQFKRGGDQRRCVGVSRESGSRIQGRTDTPGDAFASAPAELRLERRGEQLCREIEAK